MALAAGAGRRVPLTMAHVVHDLRPIEQALADRDAAWKLAQRLGVQFVETRVSIVQARTTHHPDGASHSGNPESIARRLRYAELARLAHELGYGFVATAHHADDQVESVVMGLLRGAGPAGLAGVAAARPIGVGGTGIVLIRPMLGVTHEHAVGLCREFGWTWAEDATNADTARLRAGVRHLVSPQMRLLRPSSPARISRTAALMRDVQGLIDDRVDELLSEATGDQSGSVPSSLSWNRGHLRAERAVVLAGLFQRTSRLLRGGKGADRVTGRLLDPVVRLVRSGGTDPKVYAWPSIEVVVTAHHVRIHRTSGAHG